MVKYAADDVECINARLAVIRRENTPLVDRIETVHEFDLDAIGGHYGLPRQPGEHDWVYRSRLKIKIGLI